MKIQAINNMNFKGLFTDKSAQNDGNWRMEYSPYSWENNNTSKMAPKARIDIYAAALPDNEEIYTSYGNNAENSVDILGTESYYRRSDGKMRKTITEVPALTREESLKVQNKKFDIFLNMKKNEYNKIKIEASIIPDRLMRARNSYNSYSKNIPFSFFTGASIQKATANRMGDAFNTVHDDALELYRKFMSYAKLRESSDAIAAQKKENVLEIELLEKARKDGKLIDISRRDIDGASNALKEALLSTKEAAGRYVALPHKTITLESILKEIGSKVNSADIPAEAVKFVENLIKKGV